MPAQPRKQQKSNNTSQAFESTILLYWLRLTFQLCRHPPPSSKEIICHNHLCWFLLQLLLLIACNFNACRWTYTDLFFFLSFIQFFIAVCNCLNICQQLQMSFLEFRFETSRSWLRSLSLPWDTYKDCYCFVLFHVCTWTPVCSRRVKQKLHPYVPNLDPNRLTNK